MVQWLGLLALTAESCFFVVTETLSPVQLFATSWTVACYASLSMGFPKDTGVGFHFLLQGIFLTQESNPCLLCWQADSLLLRLLGPGFKPWCWGTKIIQAVQCGKKKKKREKEREKERKAYI